MGPDSTAAGQPPVADRRAQPRDHQPDRDHRERLHDGRLHPRRARDHPGRRVQPGPADPQLPEPGQPRVLRQSDPAARRAAVGRLRRRRRSHLPRQGEAHRQRQFRRVDRAGHGRRRIHRLRPAQSVRRVQEGIDPVAVRAVHQQRHRVLHRPDRSASRASPGRCRAYNSESRYTIGDLGQSTSVGGSVQVGVPVARSLYTRVFVSYTLEGVHYNGDTTTLLGSLAAQCHGCVRSALGLSLQRDTRVGLPFAVQGGLQTIQFEANGGPLGGAATLPAGGRRAARLLDAHDVRGRRDGIRANGPHPRL